MRLQIPSFIEWGLAACPGVYTLLHLIRERGLKGAVHANNVAIPLAPIAAEERGCCVHSYTAPIAVCARGSCRVRALVSLLGPCSSDTVTEVLTKSFGSRPRVLEPIVVDGILPGVYAEWVVEGGEAERLVEKRLYHLDIPPDTVIDSCGVDAVLEGEGGVLSKRLVVYSRRCRVYISYTPVCTTARLEVRYEGSGEKMVYKGRVCLGRLIEADVWTQRQS